MNKLNAQQRRQALAWYSVTGFEMETIADHYGIDVQSVSEELRAAMREREAAGRSPEPVPCKVPEKSLELRYMDALDALERIVGATDYFVSNKPACVDVIRSIAVKSLRAAGRLIP